MGFLNQQFQFINIAIYLLTLIPPSSAAAALAKPGCVDRCGNISVPFPFGTTPDCYRSYSFFVTCNQSFDPPKPFLQNSTIEITDISLDGQLTLLQFIAHDCYGRNRTRVSRSSPWIRLPRYFTVNNTANKFTVVGCDTNGFVQGRRLDRRYQTGCSAMCYGESDLETGACAGLGCCQTSFPRDVWRVQLLLRSYENFSDVWSFNNCSYAFVAEEGAFKFSPQNLTSLSSVRKLPMVADWAIGNGTCAAARRDSGNYACRSANSRCYNPSNGVGYRCSCLEGYGGNPYLVDGCQDIDECKDPKLNICVRKCKNTIGSFNCLCPKGYNGDGKRQGKGCIRSQSLVLRLVAGIALGILVLLLSICCLYLELKRRRLIKTRQQFFLQNGGVLLQQKLTGRHGSPETARIFSESELRKATNAFHSSMIVGRGGFGTVYKGILPDNTAVAIKKSKGVDPTQTEQFINEVIILSQINHRNVVKLLGCCLETPAPLLVYEYISNGNLFEHVHEREKARSLSWELRVRIAAEAAGVLAYLHSAASTPIIHRDVKAANILLDRDFTAKVADFGASRMVPLDQSALNTLVQGTFGYLDPEYMQTNQLTEKSDVYSFGVVLVELLTGMKALSYERAEEERNLASFFLKADRVFDALDYAVAKEGDREEIMKVVVLARRCLKVRGEDRPFMKEVAMELEGLRHSWRIQTEDDHVGEDEELGFSGFVNDEGNSIGTVGFDSIGDHMLLPVDGGR